MKQWNELTEEDFDFFREAMESGRLFPTGMMNGGMIVFPVLSILGVYGSHGLVSTKVLSSTWSLFVQLQIYSTILLFVLSLLFFSKKLCILFQKTELLVLILSSSKFAFDFVFGFIGYIRHELPTFSFEWGLAVYCACTLLLVGLSIFRTLKLLRKGAFRKNGSGLLGRQYKEKKNLFTSNTFLGIYGFIAVATLITAELNGVGEVTFVCLLVVLMSELIYCFGEIEFIFVLYCKFRFPSFTVTPEQVAKQKQSDKILDQNLRDIEREMREEDREQKRARKLARKNKREEKKDKPI